MLGRSKFFFFKTIIYTPCNTISLIETPDSMRLRQRERENERKRERESKERARRRKGEMETPLIEQTRDTGSGLRLIG